MSDEAREALLEALVIWTRNDRTRGQDVVDAACGALVGGLDSPALRDLAGLYPDTPHETLHLTVEDVVEELGITLPVGEEALTRFALRCQARKVLDGTVTPRALAAWVHRNVGHGGPKDLQSLVIADDEYDEYTWHHLGDPEVEVAVLDVHVRHLARVLLAQPF